MSDSRIRFEVLPAGDGRWKVTRESVTVKLFRLKTDAVKHAVGRAKATWAKKQLAQLLIKGRDGRIVKNGERTFGRDPEATPG